jgi:hypothetical protein
MKPTNPIVIDGETYDLYTINLAITSVVNPDASEDANVAMRLVPTRIANGEVILANEAAIGIALGSLAGSDEATQQAVGAIQAALQAYIQAKGL